MSVLEQKANEAAQNLVAESPVTKEVAFDPLTILAIIGIFTSIFTFIKGCFTTTAATARVNKPTAFDALRVLRYTREAITQGSALDPHLEFVAEAVIKTGQKVTEDDVKAIYAEVPSSPK